MAVLELLGIRTGLQVFLEGVLTDMACRTDGRDGCFVNYGGAGLVLFCHVVVYIGFESCLM